MGIQNIIKNAQEDTPSSENGPFFEETEEPLIIDIYSDTSDTESFSELHDADDLLNIISYSSESYDSDDEFSMALPPSPVLVEMNQQTCEPHNILTVDTHRQETSFVNENKRRMKNITNKSRRSSMGKKKARRFENARQLALLIAEEDDEYDNDFMPFDCPFRFSQILEDSDLANKILNSTLDNINELLGSDLIEEHFEQKKTESTKMRKLSPAEAFNNLDSSQKTFFKRRNLPMGMVQYLDVCVFSFFQNNPTGTYISEPLTSFERMMLHSIAHYYKLNSHSFDAENRIERLTKVTNSLNYFDPPCLCLSQYLEEQFLKSSNPSSGPRHRRLRRKQN